VAKHLRALLEGPLYQAAAQKAGEQVRNEDGVGASCDAIEQVLNGASPAA